MQSDPIGGLCPSCAHVEKVTSGRGAVFLLCGRSRDDDRYPKYPRLPVRQCPGYESTPIHPGPTPSPS